MDNQKQSIRAQFVSNAIIGGMKILNKIPNKNRYMIQCLKCNRILDVSEITLRRRLKHSNEYGCTSCVKQKQWKDQCVHKPGEIVGDYELISPYTEERQTGMWNVKCLKCGANLVISYHNALKRKRSGCYFCNPGKGQLVPRKGNQSLHHKKINLLSRDQRFYNDYKNKIDTLNKHINTGRKYKQWKLTLDDFSNLIHQNCYYCGASPQYRESYTSVSNPEDKLYANGIDRIDSNKGYILENCVPCCSICNRMKLDLSQSDFYNHLRKILNYSNKCSTTISKESTLEADASGNGGTPILGV